MRIYRKSSVSSSTSVSKKTSVVTSRLKTYKGLTSGAANMTSLTFRSMHTVLRDCENIRFKYGNFSVDTDGPNPITIKAALELSNGGIYQMTFGGSRTYTLQPGEVVLTDPVPIKLINGMKIFARTYVDAGVGGKIPLAIGTQQSADPFGVDLEGYAQGDLVDQGVIPWVYGSLYTPYLILGDTYDNSPTLMLVGDSIMEGSGDSPVGSSFGVRAALFANIPHVNVAVGGESGSDFLTANSKRMDCAQYCTHAIVNYGTNDMTGLGLTAAQMQAVSQNIYNLLNNAGLQVYGCTMMPRYNMSGYTFNDAVPVSGYDGIGGRRHVYNQWVRTNPMPLKGHFDVTSLVETGVATNIWKTGYCTDGVHPVALGHDAASRAIDTRNLFKTLFTTPAQSIAAPKNVRVISGNQRAALFWNIDPTSSAVEGYNIYRDNVKINSALITTGLANGTVAQKQNTIHYVDHGLTNGTTYSYQVTSVDLFGNESPRSAASVAAPVANITVLQDLFDRVDSTTPGTATSGQAWPSTTNYAILNSDVNGIVSGRLKHTLSSVQALNMDLGGGNYNIEFSADIVLPSSGAGLGFRGNTNAANNLYVNVTPTTVSLNRNGAAPVSGGVISTITLTGTTPVAPLTAGQIYNVKVIAIDVGITVYINDVEILRVIDPFQCTGTWVGVRDGSNTTQYDNLYVKTF